MLTCCRRVSDIIKEKWPSQTHRNIFSVSSLGYGDLNLFSTNPNFNDLEEVESRYLETLLKENGVNQPAFNPFRFQVPVAQSLG